jgi:hypothetical protein
MFELWRVKKKLKFLFYNKIKMTQILIEAVFVGIMTIILGLLLRLVIFNNQILFLFLLGFLIHILCEITGVNVWYCKNGSACNFDIIHPASFKK